MKLHVAAAAMAAASAMLATALSRRSHTSTAPMPTRAAIAGARATV